MAVHSSILAWRIPWTAGPGGLQSMGSQSRIRLMQLSTVQHIRMSPPSQTSLPPATPSHPSRLSQSTRSSFLCYTAASHQLSVLHTVMYMFQCYSLNLSYPLLSLLCLYSCFANRFISIIFLDSVHIHSVQFSCSVVSDSLLPHGLQHTRLPCPSQSPGACSNSCPSNQ